jgi:hypothetical protein
MPITNDQLRRELSALGHECPLAPGGDLLLVLKGLDGPMPFLVSSGTNGVIVQFRTVGMLQYQSSPHRRLVETKVLELNNEYKLAKFAVDGDTVIGFVDLLVADSRCTREQLKRCIMVLTMVIVPCKERLKSVVETGQDPGKQAVMMRVLEQLAGGGAGGGGAAGGAAAAAPRKSNTDAKDGAPDPSGNPADFDEWLKNLIDE